MLLIIATLGVAQADERFVGVACPPVAGCGDGYRFKLEGTQLEGIDMPVGSQRGSSQHGLSLGTDWRQPTPVRLTANTMITAGGLVLTLLSVQWSQGGNLPGDLVPGQAILAGVGGGVMLLGGGAMWLSTDFSANRGEVQKGFAVRGVW